MDEGPLKREKTILVLDGEFTPATMSDLLVEFSLLAVERRDWMRRFNDAHKKNVELSVVGNDLKLQVAELQELCKEHNIDFLK